MTQSWQLLKAYQFHPSSFVDICGFVHTHTALLCAPPFWLRHWTHLSHPHLVLSMYLCSYKPWALSERPIIIMALAATYDMMTLIWYMSFHFQSWLLPLTSVPYEVGCWTSVCGACMPTSLKWLTPYPLHNFFCCVSLSSSHLKEPSHLAYPNLLHLSWFSNSSLIALFKLPSLFLSYFMPLSP